MKKAFIIITIIVAIDRRRKLKEVWELLKDHYFMSCLVGGGLNVPKWGPWG